MIRYLDTSALAKRYVAEPGSAAVRALFRKGKTLAVSRLAYAELAAAAARLCREGALRVEARQAILERLDRDFGELLVVEARADVLALVPTLVCRQPLRAYDAVQLASALALKVAGIGVELWSADERLCAAALGEGLRAVCPR